MRIILGENWYNQESSELVSEHWSLPLAWNGSACSVALSSGARSGPCPGFPNAWMEGKMLSQVSFLLEGEMAEGE